MEISIKINRKMERKKKNTKWGKKKTLTEDGGGERMGF